MTGAKDGAVLRVRGAAARAVASIAVPVADAGSKMATAAGLAGVVVAVLYVIGFGLMAVGTPPGDLPEFRLWWATSRDRIDLGSYLVPFVGIAFIWFVAALRRRLGQGEGLFFSTVYLASAFAFVATLFVAGAAGRAAIAAADSLDMRRLQEVATFSHAFGYAVFFGFTVKMAATFMMVVSRIGGATSALPAWLIRLTILLGALMIVGNTFFEITALVFPAWLAVVSVILVRLTRAQPASPAPAQATPATE